MAWYEQWYKESLYELAQRLQDIYQSGDYEEIYKVTFVFIYQYFRRKRLVDPEEIDEISTHVAEEIVLDIKFGVIKEVYCWHRYIDYIYMHYIVDYRSSVYVSGAIGHWADIELAEAVKRMCSASSISMMYTRYKEDMDNMAILESLPKYVDEVMDTECRYDYMTMTYRHVRTSVMLTMVSYPTVRLFKLDDCMELYVKMLAQQVHYKLWRDMCRTKVGMKDFENYTNTVDRRVRLRGLDE